MSEFYTFTLPNGIRCIHKRVASNVVHCAMTIGVGTRDERHGEFGMAHLVEHTIFKGTRHRRAWQINSLLENGGGELNAYTSKEETVVQTTSLTSDFVKSVDLIADLVFNATFPANEVEKEKEVIFDEINLYKDSPSERIYDDFEDLIFDGSELGHNILGSKSTLRQISTDKIKDFVERNYTTDRMVFSSIGNLSDKRVYDVAMRLLSCFSSSTNTTPHIVPASIAPFYKTIGRSTHQYHCAIGKRTYSLSDDKRVPLILLANMLGGPSANSLLGVLLREKNALTYNVEASYTPFTDCGVFMIYYSCEKEKVERCEQLVGSLTDRLKRYPVSSRQLSTAKRQFIGQFVVSTESNENYMLGVGKSYLVFNEVDSIDQIKQRINSVTAEDIVEVANELFDKQSTLIYR